MDHSAAVSFASTSGSLIAIPGMEHVKSDCWSFEVLSERMAGN
jgi:hypothetical protein